MSRTGQKILQVCRAGVLPVRLADHPQTLVETSFCPVKMRPPARRPLDFPNKIGSWLWDYFDYTKSRACRDDDSLHRCEVFHCHEQTEIIQGRICLNLGFVTSRRIYDLSELEKLVVRRNCPDDVGLPCRGFLQIVEAHPDFRLFTILVRLNENVCTRTCHGSREVHLQFC